MPDALPFVEAELAYLAPGEDAPQVYPPASGVATVAPGFGAASGGDPRCASGRSAPSS